ncbi:L-lactate permease [Arenibaculum sp.]|uniref:L-lactate permease n=1 Tax=Arenibaculum sp. TaxID=2865862 RepID=UPI002E0EE839|nr:L-lactate permease [Arenibaculum sp.]
MAALAALLPILVILVLMIGLRWSAAAAGTVGLALAVAYAVFGYGTATHAVPGPAGAAGGALAEAAFVAATILWIVFPALCIYELQLGSGAFEVLKRALGRLSSDRRIAALLVAWFFGLFMEGAAGFGTPVALAAPILVGLGFSPVRAVTLVLIGHAAGVSFGAVGTPVLPQVAVTGLSGQDIAAATGLLHGVLGAILLAFVVRLAAPASGAAAGAAGRGGAGRGGAGWGWAGLAAACFLLPFLALSLFVGPELPTLGGALVGGALFVAALRLAGRRAGPAEGRWEGAALLRASMPYAVLLALVLATRLVGPLREALLGLDWRWSLHGAFGGSVAPFYHPGTMLMLGFLLGGLAQGRRPGELGRAAALGARRLPLVAAALVAMLALSRIMVHAGMIAALAETAAGTLGPAWPLLAPAVGILGTFVTGSATASNILLTDFQQATAAALGLPVLHLVAAQGFGAAVGNIVCPHNVIAGGATVGLGGREGEVLRRTAPACAAYGAAGGILVFLLAL